MKENVTLSNTCFRYDGTAEADQNLKIINRLESRDPKYVGIPFNGISGAVYFIDTNRRCVMTFKQYQNSGMKLVSPSDYLQLLTSQPSRLTEEDLITFDKIKKGDMFECIERVILKPSGEIAFIKGKVYTCEEPTRLLDEQGMHHQLYSVEFINRHFKLAPQPPVMEGKKETLQDVIKRVSPFGTMTISNPKMLIALEDFIGQKTSSLQSEVEQLKGLLKEAQPFCGTMLRGKIEHYTSK